MPTASAMVSGNRGLEAAGSALQGMLQAGWCYPAQAGGQAQPCNSLNNIGVFQQASTAQHYVHNTTAMTARSSPSCAGLVPYSFSRCSLRKVGSSTSVLMVTIEVNH